VTVAYFDVFNGDADGICALHQLRLAEPRDSTLVTGLKRDIQLLDSVRAAAGDEVTVLDISLDRNREGLEALLACGAHVRYFDHHYAGAIPRHPNLDPVIDASGALCTSGLVDRYLDGRQRVWSVAGAFGDGFEDLAMELAGTLALDDERIAILRELGRRSTTTPTVKARTMSRSRRGPLPRGRALRGSVRAFPLRARRRTPVPAARADLQRAMEIPAARVSPTADAYVLPDAGWSRRVSGTFANRLVNDAPGRAHAVLTPRLGGGYVVSVRSVRGRAPSAVDFCRRYPEGGGRLTAAGIEALDPGELEPFLAAFVDAFAD
jgi:hypothetical protein